MQFFKKSQLKYKRDLKYVAPSDKGKVNHNTFVFADDGKKYKAVGITHSDKTFGKKICL